MSVSVAKKVYLGILCIGLLLAIIGGAMLTIRAIERSNYTPTEVIEDVHIDVEELPDDESTTDIGRIGGIDTTNTNGGSRIAGNE